MAGDSLLFRSALPEEADEILALFRRCTQVMNRNGLFNWHSDYPGPEVISKDLNEGTLFTCRKGELLLGAVTLNEDEPVEYASLSWSMTGCRVLVVHRLAVDPRFQRKGYARQLMEFAEKLAVERAYPTIHMDVYSINKPARNLYRSMAYRELEDFYFPGFTIPFTGLEKCFVSE